MRLLIIEDDEIISRNLTALLSKSGYAVDSAQSLETGFAKALTGEYDLCVVDWMLPDGDGTSLISMLRTEGITTPILLLTARSQNDDVVEGLDCGADDYLSKPYEAEILLARVRALLRRLPVLSSQVLTCGDLRVDLRTKIVLLDNASINLTPKEFSLLEYLLINKNIACSRSDLFSHVWDEQANVFSNSVDVYVRFLRKKLGPNSGKMIETIKGFGYKICDPLV